MARAKGAALQDDLTALDAQRETLQRSERRRGEEIQKLERSDAVDKEDAVLRFLRPEAVGGAVGEGGGLNEAVGVEGVSEGVRLWGWDGDEAKENQVT